jgi:phosphoribosyl 1,2-cyclic phosphodiesterase
MTDCGSVNDEMEAYIRTANHLVIEANHDEHKLLNGPYPTYLKERILSPQGHQSNDVCGELLERNWHPGLRNVWLCHLSLENNNPEVAYDTVASYLDEIEVVPGKDIFLKALDRTTPSPVYELNDKVIDC